MLERISHFRILREVGRGGMGVVYEAQDEHLGRRVAIKTLTPSGRKIDRWALDRFKTEAQAAAQITDPRVVQVYEAGEWQNVPYIAMEFVEGVDLAELIQAAGARPGEFISLTSNVTKMVQHLLDSSALNSSRSSLRPGTAAVGTGAVGTGAGGTGTGTGTGSKIAGSAPPPKPSAEDMAGTQLLQDYDVDAMLATPPGGNRAADATPPSPIAAAKAPPYNPDDFAGTQLLQDVDIDIDGLLEKAAAKIETKESKPQASSNPAPSAKSAPAAAQANPPSKTGASSDSKIGAKSGAKSGVLDAEEEAWRKLADRSPKLSEDYVRFVVTMIRDAAEVLDVAHRIGVVHRDIKPHNIMITRDGKLKVADFGLSRIQTAVVNPKEVGAAMGTPAYMSPEQCKGEADLDGRTDIYSLGVTLYQLLTFHTPFTGKYKEMVVKILGEDARPPREWNKGIPEDIDSIVMKCLSKHPGDRYENARALAADITRFLNFEPISIKRTSFSGRFYRWVRRSPLRASLVAVLIIGGGLTGWLALREKYEPFGENQAIAEREIAVSQHPFYPDAVAAMAAGDTARDAGDYKAAYEHFKQAASLFAQSTAWDPEGAHEQPALNSRTQAIARGDHPLLIARGDTLRALANQLRKEGKYQEAYELLDRAAEIYSFDLTAYKSAEFGQTKAVEHPLLAAAESKLAEARAVMGAPELSLTDLTMARDLFTQAGELFARCKPWDPKHEEQATAAQAGADASKRDTIQAAANLIAEAAKLRAEGAYTDAYARYDQARELYIGISNVYDASFEAQAMAMRSRADIKSPLYAEAESVFKEGDTLHTAGDYSLSYEKFKAARQLYRDSDPYDSAHEDQAQELMRKADTSHQDYARGTELMDLAQERKIDLDYEKAEDLYDEARLAFFAARPYDPKDEEEAIAARDRGNSEIRKSFNDAEDAFASGEEARDRKDYEGASRHFKEARRLFLASVFDSSKMDQAKAAREAADSLHPGYDAAQAKYDEARDAMKAGDGPDAEALFASAASLFALCKPGQGGSATDVQVGAPEPAELRALARDADKTKDAAAELKTERDQWRAADTLHPSARPHYDAATKAYDEGLAAHGRAEAKRKQGRDEKDSTRALAAYAEASTIFAEAKKLLETAIESYNKTFKKGR